MSKMIERSGVIPFYVKDDGKCVMMFMKPSDPKYGGAKFQIAKGKVDPGENPLEAGVREAREELGLKESNIKWMIKCGVYLSTHHIYIAEVNSMDSKNFSKTTFETGEVCWMTLDEFISNGRPLHVPIVKNCAELFKKRG